MSLRKVQGVHRNALAMVVTMSSRFFLNRDIILKVNYSQNAVTGMLEMVMEKYEFLRGGGGEILHAVSP